MTERQSSCQITFPVVLGGAAVSHEVHWTMFTAMLLETKIMQVLRFQHGQVTPPPRPATAPATGDGTHVPHHCCTHAVASSRGCIF